ncbi:MAG: hypothetical protein U1F06_10540 [Steroidobacteraceae bacterium]
MAGGARLGRRHHLVRYRSRELFVELEQLNAGRDELDAEAGCSSSRAPGRPTPTSSIADAKLRMRIPASREIETVER